MIVGGGVLQIPALKKAKELHLKTYLTDGNEECLAKDYADFFYKVSTKDVEGTAKLAVENNKIYVVWNSNNNTTSAGGDYDIFYRCNLSGSSWEPVQIISEPVPNQNINTGYSSKSAIAVENNKIFVVWQDNDNTNEKSVDLADAAVIDLCIKCGKKPIYIMVDNRRRRD